VASEPRPWLPEFPGSGRGLAEREPPTAEQRAFEAGVAAGVAEERARNEERARDAMQTLARAAEQLEAIQAEFARDRERDLHGLALAVARQMLQREVQLDPTLVVGWVRRALELLPLDTLIEVRMHPGDLAALGEAAKESLSPGAHVQLTWVADAGLDPGGFVLETPQRVVDGRADVALRQLYERLDHD
jgi:flagellar assembly protein FliH